MKPKRRVQAFAQTLQAHFARRRREKLCTTVQRADAEAWWSGPGSALRLLEIESPSLLEARAAALALLERSPSQIYSEALRARAAAVSFVRDVYILKRAARSLPAGDLTGVLFVAIGMKVLAKCMRARPREIEAIVQEVASEPQADRHLDGHVPSSSSNGNASAADDATNKRTTPDEKLNSKLHRTCDESAVHPVVGRQPAVPRHHGIARRVRDA